MCLQEKWPPHSCIRGRTSRGARRRGLCQASLREASACAHERWSRAGCRCGEGGAGQGQAPSKPVRWSGPCTSSMGWVTDPEHPRHTSEPTTAPEAPGPSVDSISCTLGDRTTAPSHLCLELVRSEAGQALPGQVQAPRLLRTQRASVPRGATTPATPWWWTAGSMTSTYCPAASSTPRPCPSSVSASSRGSRVCHPAQGPPAGGPGPSRRAGLAHGPGLGACPGSRQPGREGERAGSPAERCVRACLRVRE